MSFLALVICGPAIATAQERKLEPVVQTFAKNSVRGYSLSRDGTYLAIAEDGAVSGGAYKSVRIWDTRTGQLLRTFYGQQSSLFPTHASLSADGARLAIKWAERVVEVWNVKTGERIQSIEYKLGRIHAIWMSPNGKPCAAGSLVG